MDRKILFYFASAIIAFAFLTNGVEAAAKGPKLIYAKSYDLHGQRDLAYSGKIVGNSNQYVMVGPTTQQTVAGTGIDFFALSIDKRNGNRMAGFGQNGLVTIDFDNVGGTSRTDVATEVLVLNNPYRIAVLGESVTSKTGPVNLTFSIAMLYANDGNLVQSFNNGGKALYDIDKGNNDEIFYGDVDEKTNEMIVGGFANPGTTVGAGPAFNCALLKIDQYGKRVSSFGQNGQVIIDFNGWDDRCRAGLSIKNSRGNLVGYTVGGRTKPAPLPGANATDDQNNWRFSATMVDENGKFVQVFTDGINGFGRIAQNMNNGSFDAIKSVNINSRTYTVGNWGGWDNGVSGNKGVAIVRWDEHGIDNDYLAVLEPKQGESFDVYGMARIGSYLYVSGGIKSSAASSAIPTGILIRFKWNDGKFDAHDYGVYRLPSINIDGGVYIGSNIRSIVPDGNNFLIGCGESIKSPGGSNDYDTLSVRIQV